MSFAPQPAGKLDASRPWPGLVAFPEEASGYFYGREVECDEVFRRIHRDTATLLFGQSGLGKTSLLQAGLFPLLRGRSFLPVLMRLDYTTSAIAPAAQMAATLRQELAKARLKCTPIGEDERLWAYFHQDKLELSGSDGRPVTPVLVFDQFEEAYTLGLAREGMRVKTQQFLSELADLIENRPPDDLEAEFDSSPGLVERYVFDRQAYRIVISLREDYLAALESMRERAPSLGRNRFRLTPMNGRQALEAVVRPGGGIIAPEVGEEIIRFISQARREDPFGAGAAQGEIETLEVEPSLLSLVCHELNERRLKQGAERITHELVSGSSQSVLEEFYEGALVDQPPALRTFVEEELITRSGFRESMALEKARESVRRRGIAPEALDLLVHRRLLRVEERLQVSRIEIIHDLMIDVIRRSRANRELRLEAGALPGEWAGKSPFRGLEAYQYEDAPIFFGRADATGKALQRLLKNAETGRAFLLILRADGVGKTSLLQAGLLPRLVRPNAVLGAGLWRRATVRPGAHPGGPLAGLAEALFDAEALPELREQYGSGGPPAQMLAASGDPAAAIVAALERREAQARERDEIPAYGIARLALVVDQLEELFTAGISSEQREEFVACLQRLVESRRIFVIAALRNAFWQQAAQLAALVNLSDGPGRMDLLPPTPAELAEIIRQPAQVAGLSYEVSKDTGVGLDAALAEAASEPGALPLLSFVLETLYSEDITHRGGRVLTYATLERIGGVTGAIAARADETVSQLSPAALAELPRVLRAITAVIGDNPPRLVARAAPLEMFPLPARELINRMIDARLLVAASEGKTTTVQPAHDALLTHWRLARDLLAADRRDLETRSRVEAQATRWLVKGRERLLLLRDPDLANAVDLRKRRGEELDAATRQYIEDSWRHARRRQHLIAAAAVTFAVMAVAAAAFGALAIREREIARDQRSVAESNLQLALTSNANLLQQVKDNLTSGRITAEVASRILAEAVNTISGFDPGSRPELAKTLVQLYLTLADTLMDVGDGSRALTVLMNARQLAQRLESESGSVESRSLLASVVWRIGDVLETQGNLDEALVQYHSATQIAARDLAPQDANTQRLLAFLHNRIGDVLSARGNLAGALTEYRLSREISQRLVELDPNSNASRRDLATALSRTGGVLELQGRYYDALQSYHQSLDINEQLLQADPSNTVLLSNVALTHYRIGNLIFQQGRFGDALTSYESARSIRQKLVDTDPTNATWQSNLATVDDAIGELQQAQGRMAGALESLRKALDVRQQLARLNPQNAVWQRDLSVSYGKVGNVLVAQGNLTEALQAYRDSLAIAERLARADPGNAGWQRDLLVSYGRVGNVLVAQGNLTEALQAYRDSLAIAERLAKANPGNVGWQRDLLVSYGMVGNVLVAQGNLTEALQAYRDSLAIAERLAKVDPGYTYWQRDLAMSYVKVADVLAAQGNKTEALASYNKALEILQRLSAADPGDTRWRRELAAVQEKIAGLDR